MKSARKVAALGVVGVLSITGLAACSSDDGSDTGSGGGGASSAPKTDEPVTIHVAIDQGLDDKAIAAFDDRVKQFETANPNITVEHDEYTWDGTTFATMLAGGTLPDVFTVPFTDGHGLIANQQIADVSKLTAALPYAKEFNPNVASEGEDPDGNMWAVPIAAYGQGLHYNRKLFSAAGLDPDDPPTTWDDIRTDAKAIADKTGKAGYATMTQSNTGGWILVTLDNAMGGRAEDTSAGTADAKATVDTPEMKKALQYIQTLRWTDNSMGSNFLYDWAGINQDFAAGKIGMYVSGGGNYGNLFTQNKMNPDDYGLTVLPLEGDDAGVLGGGTLAAVSAKSTPAQQAAGVKWIDFYYMEKLTDKKAATLDAKTTADQGQPVGAPQLPIFDKATYDQQQAWIKQYVNVPLDQMTGYTDKVFDQPLLPEPAKDTQDLYALLDPVVQSVLTKKDADIDQLLSDAQSKAEKLLAKS